uniref:Variant surface glycoprotein 1125.2663 n=1 Tax=Trypanosoma brucei TaxID=5691 RepID=A0A1J0R8C3_9TRYP|nr:variant surface glycoprotein 1125.2663 [Trypanosoma brucei]
MFKTMAHKRQHPDNLGKHRQLKLVGLSAKMLFAQVISILPLLLTHRADSATVEAQQAAEFRALCSLTALLETPAAPSEPDPGVAASELEVLKLNMTAATDGWRQLFGDGSADHDWNKKGSQFANADYKSNWQEQWPNWLKAAAAIQPKEAGEEWLKQHPKPARQADAIEQLKILTAKAQELKQSYDKTFQTEVKGKKTEAQNKLNKELNGIKNGNHKTFFDFAAENTAARVKADCEGDKVGQGVLYDLACVCIAAAAANSKYCIGGPQAEAWERTKGNLQKAMNNLKQHCKPAPRITPNPGNLAAAAAAVINPIGLHGDNTAKGDKLGKSDTADCTGASDKVCAKYDEYYTDTANRPKQKKVPWVESIEQAAAALTAASNGEAQAQAIASAIKT